jgi:hypothetical protein
MTSFKRSVLYITVLMSSVPFLRGCIDPSNSSQLGVLSDFSTGTLAPFGFPPFEVPTNSTNTVVNGFDVQLAAQIAHRLGFTNGAIFLQAPPLDLNEAGIPVIGISAVSITPDNSSVGNVAFINYNDDTLAIILPTALTTTNPTLLDPTQTLRGLNALGTPSSLFQIATVVGQSQINSRQFKILNKNGSYPFIKPVTPGNVSDALNFIETNLAKSPSVNSAFFTDGPTATALKNSGQIPEGFTVVQGVTFTGAPSQISDGLGIVVPLNCCQLYVNIAQVISDMEADGTLALMRAYWGTGNFTPENLTPPSCVAENLSPENVNNNGIDNFIFTKYCPQTAQAVPDF